MPATQTAVKPSLRDALPAGAAEATQQTRAILAHMLGRGVAPERLLALAAELNAPPEAVAQVQRHLYQARRNGGQAAFLASLARGVSQNLLDRIAAECGLGTGGSVELVQAEDIVVRKLDWLWAGRLLRRAVAILEGPPEKGKSTTLADLAARESRGHAFPGEVKGREAGCVVMLAAEDDIEVTVKPRLMAAGADLTRIYILSATRDERSELVPFHLSDDAEHLHARCREVGATLIAVDPLVSYLGSRKGRVVETNNDLQVRKALLPLKQLAEDVGAAVVAVRHYRKGRGTDAIEAGGGSIAFSALARVLLAALPDPERPDGYLFAVAKNNLVPRGKRPALRYEIVPSDLDPDIGRIAWGEVVNSSADEVLSALEERRVRTTKNWAADWLAGQLAAGPRPAKELKEAGKAAGFPESTLRRAATELGIRASVSGFPATSVWSLPEEEM